MSRDPEEPSTEQTPAVNGNGNGSSYDYADKEETYQAAQNKRHIVAQRRSRISVNNKAYKSPLSESSRSCRITVKQEGKTKRQDQRAGLSQSFSSYPPIKPRKEKRRPTKRISKPKKTKVKVKKFYNKWTLYVR